MRTCCFYLQLKPRTSVLFFLTAADDMEDAVYAIEAVEYLSVFDAIVKIKHGVFSQRQRNVSNALM